MMIPKIIWLIKHGIKHCLGDYYFVCGFIGMAIISPRNILNQKSSLKACVFYYYHFVLFIINLPYFCINLL